MSYSGGSASVSKLPSGYVESYFSIDDILASQERVPCKFQLPVYGLGFIDQSSDQKDIMPGSKLECPFWLAKALCSRKRRIVSVEMPKQYREGYREILKADANVVDLHKLGPYFYTFGTQLLSFDHTESTEIAKSLLQTFQDRFRRIMDSSQNAYYKDANQFVAKLDEMERELFKAGQKGLSDFQRWETRLTDKLATSQMVAKHRKRKRAVMENS